MNKIVHYIGLDVHKETIAVSIAQQNSTEVRRYGIIGGTLVAVHKLQEGQGKEVQLIAWKAQERLHKRFRQLAAKKKSVVAATVVARELIGFVCAIACKVKPVERAPAPEIIRNCRGKVYQLDRDEKFQKKNKQL